MGIIIFNVFIAIIYEVFIAIIFSPLVGTGGHPDLSIEVIHMHSHTNFILIIINC